MKPYLVMQYLLKHSDENNPKILKSTEELCSSVLFYILSPFILTTFQDYDIITIKQGKGIDKNEDKN